MQDRPTAPELLDALAAMLFSEVREWVPRERRFQVLVAANLCAVIARELRAGAEPSLADARLFRELAGVDPAGRSDGAADADGSAAHAAEAARDAARELALRLRAGDLDADLDRVLGRLREHVRRKLAVARPGYAATLES